METKLYRFAASIVRAGSSRRRRVVGETRRRLTCDVLEGRQLLSGMSWNGASSSHLGYPGGAQMIQRSGAMGHGHRMAGGGGLRMGVGHRHFASAPGALDRGGLSALPGMNSPVSAPAGYLAPRTPTMPPAAPPADATSTTPAAAVTTPAAQKVQAPAGGGLGQQAQDDLKKLKDDTHAILAKSQVTVAQQVALRDDLQAIQQASTSVPSSTAIDALNTDLKSLAGKLPTDEQKTKLTDDYRALLKSQGVTDETLIDKTIADFGAVVQSSNMTNDDLATIAADRKAVDTDHGTSAPADQSTGLPFDLILGPNAAFGPGQEAGGGPDDSNGAFGGFGPGGISGQSGRQGPGGNLNHPGQPFGGQSSQRSGFGPGGARGQASSFALNQSPFGALGQVDSSNQTAPAAMNQAGVSANSQGMPSHGWPGMNGQRGNRWFPG